MAMQWRTIPGFPEYEVSEFGDVRRCAPGNSNACKVGKILRPTRCGGGRCYVGFSLARSNRMYRVTAHRAVALAFLGLPPSPAHEVAHSDGNPSNNHFSNLRWATPRENAADKVRHGTVAFGERCKHLKITAPEITEIRGLSGLGFSQNELAKLFATSQSHIGRIVRRELWRHVP